MHNSPLFPQDTNKHFKLLKKLAEYSIHEIPTDRCRGKCQGVLITSTKPISMNLLYCAKLAYYVSPPNYNWCCKN